MKFTPKESALRSFEFIVAPSSRCRAGVSYLITGIIATNDEMLDAKGLGRLPFSAGRESNFDYLRSVSRVYFCRHTGRWSWEITFSDRATIYQLNEVWSMRRHKRAAQRNGAGIDRSTFEDSLRCRARERGSDNIAGLFMDRWAATVLRRRRSPIALS